jgi:hypothetical protein
VFSLVLIGVVKIQLTQMVEGREVCNVCVRAVSNPYRRYDERGNVVEGCVSGAHTGHLIAISESNRWHNRVEAKQIRRNMVNKVRSIH